MAATALILANNLSHNVSTHIEAAKTSLSHLATVYLVTEVAGQSKATVDAKQRDLQRFLTFYQKLYNHDWPDEWFVSVTKALGNTEPGAGPIHGQGIYPCADQRRGDPGCCAATSGGAPGA